MSVDYERLCNVMSRDVRSILSKSHRHLSVSRHSAKAYNEPVDTYMADDPHLAQHTPSVLADGATQAPPSTAGPEAVQEPAPLPGATQVDGDTEIDDTQVDMELDSSVHEQCTLPEIVHTAGYSHCN